MTFVTPLFILPFNMASIESLDGRHMFIIKHKTRRRTGRAHSKNATVYYTLYGADGEAGYSSEDLNDVAEALNDVLKGVYSAAPNEAKTLWDVYHKDYRYAAYQAI